ncbi:hypothetical protein Rsub_10244 [Raphidocelis subcapitata]|uniref:Purple acid phosphatase n=1 Tax=Raphidocelis subcapitata TaxID=307507 RepID=A0A2V0PEF0_9CHLO|nr:hypothetical protein Rsub_10244 [Raphidocelis subcapitata]|eukprot:GBF97889.1 hypothetical protein Rsub_10244 [Raphidocelis subcapitata]
MGSGGPMCTPRAARAGGLAVLCLMLTAARTAQATTRPGARWIASSTGEADFDQDCEPRQVRIAFGEDATSMSVSWKTYGSDCRSEVTWWRDRWGGAGALLPFAAASAAGYSFLLSERDMAEAPASDRPFTLYVHRAVMTGLAPGARYRYRLGGGGGGGGGAWGFRAGQPGGRDVRTAFVAVGDMGDPIHAASRSPGAPVTIASILRRDAAVSDFLLHVGDIAYADGNPEVWDSFLDAISPLASRLPYLVQVGNHEAGCNAASDLDPSRLPPPRPDCGGFGPDSGGECGAMVSRLFHMPSGEGGERAAAAGNGRPGAPRGGGGSGGALRANPPFWYTFEHGRVAFVAVSTEHDLSPGSPQREWLEGALASVDRCATPWLLLLAHRPLYVAVPDRKGDAPVGEFLRASLEPLLDEFQVDAVISGHVHAYYRTCPLAGGRCLEDADADAGGDAGVRGSADAVRGGGGARHGTVHIVVGASGHKLLSDLADAGSEDQEAWVAASRNSWGYMRFETRGDFELAAEFVASETGAVLDSFAIDASEARRARGLRCGARAA